MKRTKFDLLSACEAEGVPAGPINDLSEVFEDEQVVHRGLRAEIDGIPTVRAPFRFSGADLKIKRASPKLNEHGAEIRAGLKKR